MSSAKINLTQIHSALINSFRVGLFQRSKSEMYQDIPGSFPSDLKANGVTVREILTFLDLLFYKHSAFQSEARICLSFSQIEPQNMLKISLS